MKDIQAIIDQLKSDWSTPRVPRHIAEIPTLPAICVFSPFRCFIPYEFPFDVPESLRTFWDITEKAHLFKEFTYGQWGLEIKSPYEALHFHAEEIKNGYRKDDFRPGEFIFGRFIGDCDLLFISCAPDETHGNVMVALSIEPRRMWPVVASDFSEFLFNYSKYEGDMYWQYGKK
jgi:hypothetical protein